MTTTATELRKLPSHPAGHRVRDLEDVWSSFGNEENFLKMCESGNLSDVWIQLRTIHKTDTYYPTVEVLCAIFGSQVYFNIMKTRMSIADIANLLYLNDCLQCYLQGVPPPTFDDWFTDKTVKYINATGDLDGSVNKSLIYNFVVQDDRDFTFYPRFLHNVGIFFRKTTVHGYKNKGKPIETETEGMPNRSITIEHATRGKFEYEIEGRIFILPDEWWVKVEGLEEDVPASQPINTI